MRGDDLQPEAISVPSKIGVAARSGVERIADRIPGLKIIAHGGGYLGSYAALRSRLFVSPQTATPTSS